ncbi:hypothetical protein BTJ68_14817 [Hortaea werneckii EXF-2000]|uniref:Uncharacterized protein n=1 Tax=Hortaea werneckii EXF-2000 TaxID=1157616 RepID=A0A1Z5SN59_HORWE|nr:hypothetical protein BTJ68_14817 [Hortaea werneckii EXF-2000]
MPTIDPYLTLTRILQEPKTNTATNFRYEGDLGLKDPHKKSGGQLGTPQTTTDPSHTPEGAQAAAARTERNMENIRYGQTLSETGGVGGMTQGQQGIGEKEGFGGGVGERFSGDKSLNAVQERKGQGYGGKTGYDNDMNREIGG